MVMIDGLVQPIFLLYDRWEGKAIGKSEEKDRADWVILRIVMRCFGCRADL